MTDSTPPQDGPSIEEQIAAARRVVALGRHALEDHRQVRLRAGHNDIGAGTDHLGLWDSEVADIAIADALISAYEAQSRELAEARAEIERLKASETAWIRRAATALSTMNQVQEKHRNPCAKILNQKWLDPECVETGCQSLRLRAQSGKDAMEVARKVYWEAYEAHGVDADRLRGDEPAAEVTAIPIVARTIESARAEVEARFRPLVEAGWKEATIAWSVCASIHREYGKRRDALYTTRQADFLKHETDARAALAALEEGNQR